jgi:hypothetical protein
VEREDICADQNRQKGVSRHIQNLANVVADVNAVPADSAASLPRALPILVEVVDGATKRMKEPNVIGIPGAADLRSALCLTIVR